MLGGDYAGALFIWGKNEMVLFFALVWSELFFLSSDRLQNQLSGDNIYGLAGDAAFGFQKSDNQEIMRAWRLSGGGFQRGDFRCNRRAGLQDI